MKRLIAAMAAACLATSIAVAAPPRAQAKPQGGWTLYAPGADPRLVPGMAAIVDPPRDPAHPARNKQLLIDSHGAKMNALFFLAAGAGRHPTVLLLHGLPGN